MPGVTTSVDRTGEEVLRIQVQVSRGKARLARVARIMSGFGAGVRYGVHHDNLKNLARGIVERVFFVEAKLPDGTSGLLSPPKPVAGAFTRLKNLRSRLLHVLHPTPVVDRDEYPGLYTGRKRALYERAAASLKVKTVGWRDAIVSTFVKAEKINFTKKVDPAPRVIQPRSPRYNLEVGRYLKLFEKEMFMGFERVFGYPVVSKGLNAQKTGSLMQKHWARYNKPVAVGLDAKRFDQHVSVEALRFEHSFYNSVFRSAELCELLDDQIENKGIARVGKHRVDYRVDGCRMSGDINTGLGNCILMACIVIAYCEEKGFDFRLINNGDDCVVFLDQRDLHQMDDIDQWFLEFGFQLTREAPVFTLERVEFCQAQPVQTANGWRMVRSPLTAMSKDCVSLVSWETVDDIKEWCHAIGSCGSSLTSGVPVWASWYGRLVRLSGGSSKVGVNDRILDSGLGYMSAGVKGCPITAECRVSFYKAFGILPDLQVALEAEYDSACSIAALTPMTFPNVKAIDLVQNPLAVWLQRPPDP